jgi:hypothetical protein
MTAFKSGWKGKVPINRHMGQKSFLEEKRVLFTQEHLKQNRDIYGSTKGQRGTYIGMGLQITQFPYYYYYYYYASYNHGQRPTNEV